jgi:hypothetical protein
VLPSTGLADLTQIPDDPTLPAPLPRVLTSSGPNTMALTKKRKASALEDGTPVKNGHKSPNSGHGTKNEETKKIPDKVDDAADTPFRVECPAHPNKRKSKTPDDVFGPEHEDAGFENLDITYAVRPGSAWSSLKPYRNFIGKHPLQNGSWPPLKRNH